MTTAESIRLVIVDDDVVLAEALGQVWEAGGEIEIVGVAHTGADGLAMAQQLHPSLILMDQHLPDMNGSAVTAMLSAELPDVPVLMLTRDDSDETLLEALESGVSGFLLKRSGIREVSDALRRAAAGEMLMSRETLARLTAALRKRRHREEERLPIEQLTARELEVLRLMNEGLNTRGMAERLVLTQATVRTHVAAVLSKLDAHSRLEAVARAARLGIIPQ